jgi:hypothetical protein
MIAIPVCPPDCRKSGLRHFFSVEIGNRQVEPFRPIRIRRAAVRELRFWANCGVHSQPVCVLFWNGACFGIIFALDVSICKSWWGGSLQSRFGRRFPRQPGGPGIGASIFSINFGWHLAATVLTAHLVFPAGMAVTEFCRSRKPIAVSCRLNVLSKFPSKLGCKKFRFGRTHSWKVQENFPRC